MKIRMGLLYGLLVALILVLGVWWVYYLTSEGRVHAEHQLQKLANDRLHATFLLQADPQVRADPEAWLGESFPALIFRRTAQGIQVEIDPAVVEEVHREARATRNMFLYEGIFFLVLLAAGATILILSWRSEVRYKRAREFFLAGATHEFKTPLASLRLYAETLGREGLRDTAREGIQRRMVQDVNRLEGLVDDMLAMSAGDTFAHGPRVRLDLIDECRRVLDDLRSFAADHDAEFHLSGDAGAIVSGHRLFFGLALRNLLVNAVTHAPHPARVEVTVNRGDKWHRVAVRDHGPGIPRRLHERVFECFYSTSRENRRSGTGLGLYLVRRNVEDMGGKVELESEEQQGCTFTMILPAAAAKA